VAACARYDDSTLLTYHTYGGEIRDPLAATDESDLNIFAQLTHEGVAATGYRSVRSGIGGAFLQWAYSDRGIVAYLTECWDLLRAAGLDFSSKYAPAAIRTLFVLIFFSCPDNQLN